MFNLASRTQCLYLWWQTLIFNELVDYLAVYVLVSLNISIIITV